MLPLITAIEFSALQCREMTSISTVTMRPDETIDAAVDDNGEKRSLIEEEKTLIVQSHQGYSSYKELSKLEGEKDSLTPTTTISEIEETKVLIVN